ncbi:lactonase family protein [Pontibacter sp. MBLB2868]|uniref:lactonase family protein n=1 Tax=Pontibacter sp. MBLB2868 TaxID=3451555 RepID=UPI003F752484
MVYSKYQGVRSVFREIIMLGLACTTLAFSSCTTTTSGNANDSDVVTRSAGNTSRVYVGTYAEPDNESIFLYNLNAETGALTRMLAVKAGANPSYLALDAQQKHLYAVNETTNYEGTNSGAVSAFAVNQQTGGLTILNKVPSMGGAPCHISVDEANKVVLVANYVGGNVAAFPVQEDGKLGEAAAVQQHQGVGPNKKRQETPHAHYIGPGPDNKYAFAVDLGTDQILGYKLQRNGKVLAPVTPAVTFAAAPGAGPRHMVFHPNGRFAFVLNELNSTMTALAYNSENGTFSEVQSVATVPADFKENNQPAAVKISPDGKFLYGSNRGHNSIVVFAIDKNTGKLTLVQHESTGGDWPRDFTIDLTGNVLLVANERSNNIVSFKIDRETGKLTNTGYEVEVHKPTCLKVVAAL